MGFLTDDPDEFARLTADPSPLNPIPQQMYAAPAGPRQPERNPFVSPIDPYEVLQKGPLGQAYRTAQQGATGLFNLAGKADVAAGLKDPATAASRAETYGPLAVDAALGRALPTGAGAVGNAALNAFFGGGTAALKGSSPGEAAQAGGIMGSVGGGAEKIGQGLKYLVSAVPAKAWASKSGQEVADWLLQNVPAWSEIKDIAGLPAKGVKALYEMAHGEGENLLSASYDKALTAAKNAIPEGTKVSFPEEFAKALKLDTARPQISRDTIDSLLASGKTLPEIMGGGSQVEARDLLAKLPGTTGAVRTAIREALGDYVPKEALQAYKTGMGWIDFARKGNFLKGESYDPVVANEALRKYGADELLSRGMQPVREAIRGPLADPISRQVPSSLPWYAGKLLGGAGAAALGAMHGSPLTAGAGLLMTAIPKPSFYRNVPPMMPQAGPLAQQGLRAVMPGFLGNMRSSSQED